MILAVPDRRATVLHRAEGLQLEIPPRRSVFSMIFLPIWLIGWGFGEIAALRILITQQNTNNKPFIVLWLVLWTIGGGMALYSWLAQVIGKEIVTLSHSVLTIKRDVTGFEKAAEYDLSHIRNLRVTERPNNLFGRRNQASPFSAGTIAFDYGAKTYSFAAGVDEAEATMIISDLRKHHAFSA